METQITNYYNQLYVIIPQSILNFLRLIFFLLVEFCVKSNNENNFE